MNLLSIETQRDALRQRWDLLWMLVFRDMKVRYEGTVLGFAWAMLNPLLYLGVFIFLFRIVHPLDIPRFSSFVLIGLLTYGWFQNALPTAASSVLANRELVRRPGFPVAVLPAVPVVTEMVHFLLAWVVIGGLLLFVDGEITLAAAALPFLVLIQLMITLGVAYFVASSAVFFRDTAHILGVLLRLGFFLTPIFYDPRQVPDKLKGLYHLNPFVSLLQGYRGTLMPGVSVDGAEIGAVCAFAVVIVIAGYYTFVRTRARFFEEI